MIDGLIRAYLTQNNTGTFQARDKILFFKELSHLLSGGVGITESLTIMSENAENMGIRSLCNALYESINQGKSLSIALSRYAEYFDAADVATIQSGEKAGNLTLVLRMLADEYAYLDTLRNKVIGALTYPAVLIVISFGAIISLFVFVLPSIFAISDQFPGMQLPWITVMLKDFSEFLATNVLYVLGAIVFLIFGGMAFGSTKQGLAVVYRTVYSIPHIGTMIQGYYLVRFARYAKILLTSGLSFLEVFTLLKNVIDVPLFTTMFDTIIDGLNRGKNITDGMKDTALIMPASVVALIKVGEKTASMAGSFDTIISIYSEELEHRIGTLSKIIEPIMLVFVGGVIVMIALGVFGVIMSIMDSVGV